MNFRSMNENKILIIGYFEYETNQLDGQTEKTNHPKINQSIIIRLNKINEENVKTSLLSHMLFLSIQF